MDLRELILPFQVIQRDRNPSTKLELVKTVSPAAVLEWPLTRQKEKGWGVRAASKIPRGTFVGIYAGELITEEESEARGELYTEIGRT